MGPTRFQRIERLFDEAIDLPPSERRAFLRTQCGEDGELVREVERLLERADEPITFDGVPATSCPDAARALGTTIGPYHLRGVLGEGGFGVVYRAEQTYPIRRDVALKIVKAGAGARDVLTRFETERQTLARLDHPSIARVIDAGVSDDGRPYFAMELVDGVDITTFCDERRLDVDARIELFLEVCSAVQHAHQKGIIHRDLKPSNVLVSEVGGETRCRVIDFGIAKALTRDAAPGVTQPEDLIGTPAYMSPEQAAGSQDVDTRADIHALGVILFELLTGSTPYAALGGDVRTTYEWRRLIESREPSRPSARLVRAANEVARRRGTDASTLRRRLRGDLDWIVMRAIDKDRMRRYPTADALAADLRRHLAEEPVEAGPPNAAYRLRKFVRRHRIAVGAGAVVTLALVGGVTLATLGLVTASRQRDQALERLYDSLVAQVRQLQHGQERGRRAASLELVAQAAEIRPGLELRTEAIGCLVMDDLECASRLAIDPAPGARPSMQGLVTLDRFAHAGPEAVVIVRDARHGDVIARLDGPDVVPFRLVFSPDGRYLAVKHHEGRDFRLWVWDVDAEAPVLALDDAPDMRGVIAFAPDGTWIAVGEPAGRVRRYAVPGGAALTAVEVGGRAAACAVSPRDGELAVAVDGVSAVAFHDAETGVRRAVIETQEPPVQLAFDRDGGRVAVAAASGEVSIWNRSMLRRIVTLPGHQGRPRSLAFDDSGRWLASHGWDATTRLWDLERRLEATTPFKGQQLVGFADALVLTDGASVTEWRRSTASITRTLDVSDDVGEVPVLTLAPDGRVGALGGEDGIRLVDLATYVEIGRFAEGTQAFTVDFTRGGELVAATDRGVLAWPVRRSGEIVRVGAPRRIAEDARTTRACLTADGAHLIVCGPRSAHLVDLEDPRQRQAFGDGGRWGSRPSVTPDGVWLFTGTWRGPPAAVWDLRTLIRVREYEGTSVGGAFDPTGRTLVVAQEDAYRLLEVGVWRERLTIDRETGSRLAGPVGFTPDGRVAALTVGDHASIVLLDLERLTKLAVLRAPQRDRVTGLVFSPDGGTLFATTRATAPLVVWDLRTLRSKLAALGLDWDGPAIPAPAARPRAPLRMIPPPDNVAAR